tara:strand:- start:232 stop:525 length:294 start_codon:yes stop_codon:yes gene_type:complete
MQNRMRSTERAHLKQLSKKVYLTITLMLLGLISCSKAVKFQRELPEKLNYSNSEFVNCNPEISGYLCMKNIDAINSVVDLKNCQEQNKFLREMLDGN